jgi:uncharacterized membrane protein YeaQ/YmgE (transglycosylase-associated protein family)
MPAARLTRVIGLLVTGGLLLSFWGRCENMGLFNIVCWIVFGLIVGAIARFLLPGAQSMGWLATILLGVIGSFAGGTLSALALGQSEGNVQPAGWLMSIVGAIVVLFAYSRLSARK